MNNYHKIPEIRKVNKEYRDLKRKLNKRRNKVSSLFNKYSFIEEIVSPSMDDYEIEESVRRLFDDLGYSAKRPNDKRDFDVIASNLGKTIGIEIKNGKNLVGENEMFQALKYAGRHRSKGKVLHPIMIWNNSKSNQEFDKYRIYDSKINNYGILTTKELLKGYLKFKQEKLTFALFDIIISQTGLIKFSISEIKRMESSEAER